ncbi:hypothetical protein DIPPA_24702 [Diplonema papillatum]|nr:hypothetical protein DIPPA_24702 [Diplonema papillatum]
MRAARSRGGDAPPSVRSMLSKLQGGGGHRRAPSAARVKHGGAAPEHAAAASLRETRAATEQKAARVFAAVLSSHETRPPVKLFAGRLFTRCQLAASLAPSPHTHPPSPRVQLPPAAAPPSPRAFGTTPEPPAAEAVSVCPVEPRSPARKFAQKLVSAVGKNKAPGAHDAPVEARAAARVAALDEEAVQQYAGEVVRNKRERAAEETKRCIAVERAWAKGAAEAPVSALEDAAGAPADELGDLMYSVYYQATLRQHAAPHSIPQEAAAAMQTPDGERVVSTLQRYFPRDVLFDLPPSIARVLLPGLRGALERAKIFVFHPPTEYERAYQRESERVSHDSRIPGLRPSELEGMQTGLSAMHDKLESLKASHPAVPRLDAAQPVTCIIRENDRGSLPEFNNLIAAFRAEVLSPVQQEHNAFKKGLYASVEARVKMNNELLAKVDRVEESADDG